MLKTFRWSLQKFPERQFQAALWVQPSAAWPVFPRRLAQEPCKVSRHFPEMGRRDPCHAWRCLLHYDDSSHPMDAEPNNHRQTRRLRALAREVQFRFQVKTCLSCTEELPIVIEIGSRRGNLLANLHEMPQSLSVDQRYNRQWTCLSLRRICQNIFNFSPLKVYELSAGI